MGSGRKRCDKAKLDKKSRAELFVLEVKGLWLRLQCLGFSV